MLLERSANVNATSTYGLGSPLQAATKDNHETIVRLLLEKGANVDNDAEYGTALHIASYGGYQKLVRMFLDKGANARIQEEAKL